MRRSISISPRTPGAGHFLGDYMGLKTVGQDFLAVFGQSPAQNITSQYFRRLSLAK